MRWDYFVRHYADDAKQQQDKKYVAEYNGKPVNGVWYPRAGCLGGCTAHNAMIIVYPHNEDWDQLASLTGDPSWGADSMRTYFQKLENCQHRPDLRIFAKAGSNPSRHGFDGWLHTEITIPKAALTDFELESTLTKSLAAELEGLPSPI